MKPLEIKGARVRLGYTQQDVADRLGLSLSSYKGREDGKTKFTIEEVPKLAEILELSMGQINDFLFDGELPVA